MHECPGHGGAQQRALLTTGAVNLIVDSLPLNALPRAGEAELVITHRRALHKVRVFQALQAQGALE